MTHVYIYDHFWIFAHSNMILWFSCGPVGRFWDFLMHRLTVCWGCGLPFLRLCEWDCGALLAFARRHLSAIFWSWVPQFHVPMFLVVEKWACQQSRASWTFQALSQGESRWGLCCGSEMMQKAHEMFRVMDKVRGLRTAQQEYMAAHTRSPF